MPTVQELEDMERDYAYFAAQKTVKPDAHDWLKSQCSRLLYGQCSTLRCLKRGGYVSPPEGAAYPAERYEELLALATCEPYEIERALKAGGDDLAVQCFDCYEVGVIRSGPTQGVSLCDRHRRGQP